MADIPSVGINTAGVTDPGMVNVEDQAYPRPLDLAQSLALNLGRLIAGSQFQPNGPTAVAVPLPIPRDIDVEAFPFILPSLSLGTPIPSNVPEIDVEAQNVLRQPVIDFIITESGSFATNLPVPTTVSVAIASVTFFDVTDSFGITRFYVLNFAASVNLMDFGVDLTGTEALFPNSAPPLNPQDVPAGFITKFSNRQLVVDGTDLTLIPPTTGNIIVLDVSRHGSEVVFDLFPPDLNVTIDAVQSASEAITDVADSRRVIDAFASDGVVRPFIGAGTRIPLLLYLDLRETAFFPSDQPIKTLGLPVNVNVG